MIELSEVRSSCDTVPRNTLFLRTGLRPPPGPWPDELPRVRSRMRSWSSMFRLAQGVPRFRSARRAHAIRHVDQHAEHAFHPAVAAAVAARTIR